MDRRVLWSVCFVLLIVTSGCLGLVTDDTVTFESSTATVSNPTLDQTEYTQTNRSSPTATRTISRFGVERTVRITNHRSRYDRTLSLGPLGEHELGRFVVLSTPAVEIAGRSFNPVVDWSPSQIIAKLSAESGTLEDISHRNNRTLRILGDQRTVGTFSARTTVGNGRTVDLILFVTTFRHGDDFIVAVGLYPKRLPDERQRIEAMFRGLDH